MFHLYLLTVISCFFSVIEANNVVTQKKTTVTTVIKKAQIYPTTPFSNKSVLQSEPMNAFKKIDNLEKQFLQFKNDVLTEQKRNEIKLLAIMKMLEGTRTPFINTSKNSRLDEIDAELKSHKDMLQQIRQYQVQVDTKVQATLSDVKKTEKLILPTKSINGKQYFLSLDQPKMTWPDAERFCKFNNMELISVETEQELLALRPEFQKLVDKFHHKIWSSGKYNEAEKQWKWTAGNTKVTFFANSVENEKDLCLYLSNLNDWMGYSCLDVGPFICES